MNSSLLEKASDSIVGLPEDEKAYVLHESSQVLPGLLRDLERAVKYHGYEMKEAMNEMTYVLELEDNHVDLAIRHSAGAKDDKDTVLLFLFWCAVICCFVKLELPLDAIKDPAIN